ncbi:MAG: glycerophosphodiester phosphodiesterase [Acetobacteraceae bacterium]|nr:glycerophosphodiester phosphodiesterase [Acetobacteraceae bacterium]MBV8525329.1 glycerophosphodiester phosphodiesterase [Acetobacteraceae bacterium]
MAEQTLKLFDLQGHRGARGLFPENTLEGFRQALRLGVTTLEMDVGMTADGVVVVSHDPALNPDITRYRKGTWLRRRGPLIRSVRASALAGYDVGRIKPGSLYAFRFPEQEAADGAAIPALSGVLQLAHNTRFNVELKTFPHHPEWTASPSELAAAAVEAAERCNAVGRLTLQSFDWRGLRYIRAHRPDIALGWLTCPPTTDAARLWWDGPDPRDYGRSIPRAVAAEGGGIWGPEYASLAEPLVAEAHALGLRVVPWTVNRPADMRRLIRWGVDGLITDRPDIAQSVLRSEQVTAG